MFDDIKDKIKYFEYNEKKHKLLVSIYNEFLNIFFGKFIFIKKI